MTTFGGVAASLAAAASLAGCAFVPARFPRLDEAHAIYAQTAANPQVPCLVPGQLAEAADALELADRARNTLDDPAHVDHLAYVASRRALIAQEAAKHAATQRWRCP